MSRKYVQQIFLHPCLRLNDFESLSYGCPIDYVHHFIPRNHSVTWPQGFKVHICFIPTTFEVCIVTSGSAPTGAHPLETPLGILKQFRSAQAFPGGFTTDEKFRELLIRLENAFDDVDSDANIPWDRISKRQRVESTEHGATPYCTIPGSIIAELGPKTFLVEVAASIHKDTSDSFLIVHRRIEWFMHFFIDSLSPIEVDERWRIFVAIKFLEPSAVYEEFMSEQGKEENSENMSMQFLASYNKPIQIVGITTAYQFFCIPNDRLRVSQVFVFPEHQRSGVGMGMFNAIVERVKKGGQVQYISVEDPAPHFQYIRDVVTIRRALQYSILNTAILHPVNEGGEELTIIEGTRWPDYVQQFKEVLLECPTQVHRLKWLLIALNRFPSELLTNGGLEEWNSFTHSDATLNKWRLRVKRKIQRDNIETYTNASVASLQASLEEAWKEVLEGICKSARGIRIKLTNGTLMN